MASTTSFLCRWTRQTLFQLRFFCLRQLSSSLTESAECFRNVPFRTTGRACQDVRRFCSVFVKVSRSKAPSSQDITFVDYRPVATYCEQALLPATTDRFFNGLLQQHHFGPREIDFYGSEAPDDLFVSLFDHGVIVPVSSLTAPRRDRLGRLIRF